MAPENHNRARLGIALLLLLQTALVAAPYLDPKQPGNPRWEWVYIGTPLVTMSVGVWRAKEWARFACATISLLLAVGWLFLASAISKLDRTPPGSTWIDQLPVLAFPLSLAGLWIVIGFYCLRPSTRQAFAQAREARARTGGTSP